MENYIWFSYHEDSLIVHWKKKDKRKIDKYQQYLYICIWFSVKVNDIMSLQH